jgi:hypothetical protein
MLVLNREDMSELHYAIGASKKKTRQGAQFIGTS